MGVSKDPRRSSKASWTSHGITSSKVPVQAQCGRGLPRSTVLAGVVVKGPSVETSYLTCQYYQYGSRLKIDQSEELEKIRVMKT